MKRIDVKLGYSCNNNCLFCILGDRRLHYPDLTTEQALDKIKDARKKGFEKIVLTGGEPTIRKDILKLVKYASKQRFKIIHIESNGIMFSYPEFTKKMIAAGANYFTISLHADDPGLYSILSNTEEKNFYRLMNGLKNLRSSTKNIGINCTITKMNYKRLKDIVNLCSRLDIKSIHFPFLNPSGNALKNNKRIIVAYKDLKPFLLDAIKLAKEKNMNVSTEMIPPCIIPKNTEIIEELRSRDMSVDALEYYDPNFSKTQITGRIKGKACSECLFNRTCDGFMENYFNIYGENEMIPIKDKDYL